MYSYQKKEKVRHCGFTLIETLIAVGLFSIVTTIASGAFLVMVNADRTSRALRIATDNLNLALEDMSRRIKTGTTYGCGVASGTQDCLSPAGVMLSFSDQVEAKIRYKRGEGAGSPNANPIAGCGSALYVTSVGGVPTNKGCILRSTNGAWVPVTSHEIDVKILKFLVEGSSSVDNIQPYAVILIEGEVNAPPHPALKFKMQTMVTQRQLDV